MIAAIVLAAGASSRMGQPKQLLDINGETLLRRTVRIVGASEIERIVTVLSPEFPDHVSTLGELRCEVVINKRWASGMGSSIKAGLDHITRDTTEGVNAVIIFVCDQPHLDAGIINNLIRRYRESRKDIIAATYRGVPGVPVLFDRSFFEKLRMLPDDQGAKKIVLENRHQAELVAFPGGEIDLDTPDDYRKFLERM